MNKATSFFKKDSGYMWQEAVLAAPPERVVEDEPAPTFAIILRALQEVVVMRCYQR